MAGSGEQELAELEQAPDDPALAQAPSEALALRAAMEVDFRTGLGQWYEGAKLMCTDGEVHNTISGGSFHGLTVQGRNFSGILFTTSPPLPAAPEAGVAPR
ncbi:hypothetical protein ABT186_43480 [Streptomyces sp. NPDC001634]|uniref:hypothetical protein n=1 Tax=Streptomyces sp. NPDC001634 TaxID=3154390 RepID=UPI0033188A6F